MRRLAALAVLPFLAAGAASAESIPVYAPAGELPALTLPSYRPPLEGARELRLDVGIGSGLFRAADDPPHVYHAVSDRGPNFACQEAEDLLAVKAEEICPEADGAKAGAGRLYPLPDYNVSIYQITLDPDAKTFTVSDVIPLKTASGKPIVGMTNPLTMARTEVPRDGSGTVIAQNPDSIDAEALVRLADGRFFIAEENAPSVVEVSAEGVITRRHVPAGTEPDFAGADYEVVGTLPAILAKRQSNRGLESIALGDDSRTLYTLMQNPLANPDAKAYGDAVNTRLLQLTIGEGSPAALEVTAEYVYQLDDFQKFAAAGASDAKRPSSLRISEMLALGNGHFLVDERTDEIAKLFEITVEGATNILGTEWDDPATSPSLEQADLETAGIVPVRKTEMLVASSLGEAAIRYPAKIEGLALTAEGDLVIINDNDFGIAGLPNRVVVVKDSGIGPR